MIRTAFFLLALLYLGLRLSSPMPAVHGDGYYTYLWARSLVFDGDLDLANDYAQCGDPWGLTESPIGPNVNYWNIGSALFWVPPLALARATHLASDSTAEQVREGCIGTLAEVAVSGSMAAGWLTALFGFLIARRYFAVVPALIGSIGIAVLTGLLYHSSMLLSYGHAASSCASALFVWVWDRYRIVHPESVSLRGWLVQGLALGFAVLCRTQNVVLVLLPFLVWLCSTWPVLQQRRWKSILRLLVAGFLFVLGAALVFAPQVYLWYDQFGQIGVPQGEHYMRWAHPRPIRVLFSMSNGLFVWSPIHYVATVGLFLAWRNRKSRWMAAASLGMFAISAYVVGSVYDWWGSIGYPGRRFDMMAPFFMFGLAAGAAAVVRWLRIRPASVVAVLGITVLGFFLFANHSLSFSLARAVRTDQARSAYEVYPAVVGHGMAAVERSVGNPLTWPASIPFALQYGVHPRRWAQLGGQEFFYHQHQLLTLVPETGLVSFASESGGAYLDGRVEEQVRNLGLGPARVLHPGSTRVLLPLHFPEVGELRWTLFVPDDLPRRVSLTVNGEYVGTKRLPVRPGRWVEVAFTELPLMRHSINELWIYIEGGPVGLKALELRDRRPAPSIEQERRNDLVRERVRRFQAARRRDSENDARP